MIKVGEYPRQMQWFRLHLELLHQALDHFSRDPAALKTFVENQEKKFSDGLNVYLKTEEDRPRHPIDDMFVRAYGKNLARQVRTTWNSQRTNSTKLKSFCVVLSLRPR